MKKENLSKDWLKKDYQPRFSIFCKNCKFFIENAWNITGK